MMEQRIWYSRHPELGVSIHRTADDAERAAHADLAGQRPAAGDFWHEAIDTLSWGELIPHGVVSPDDEWADWALVRLPPGDPDIAPVVARLRRILAVEGADEAQAPKGWVASRLGGWGRIHGKALHGRVARGCPQGWAWSWTEPRPRQDGFGPSGSAVVYSGQAPTALEAMEAADAAVSIHPNTGGTP